MATISRHLLITALAALFVAPTFAASRLEFGTKATYTSNLLADWSGTEDIYFTSDAAINFYPLSFLELNANGLLKSHRDQVKYDNRTGGLGMTLVAPMPGESPLAVHSEVLFNGSRYGQSLAQYCSNNLSVRAAAGYWVAKSVRVRLGLFHDQNAYLSSDEMDKQSYEAYCGVNLSFLGSNALDVEAGFAVAEYRYISPDGLEKPDIIDPDLQFVTFSEGHLESFYISPRYSRPVGSRSGIGFTFTYKEFPSLEEGVVYSASADNLSPWLEVWQGRSVSCSFKTYLVPRLVISTGFDYSSRSFLRVLDDPEIVRYSKVPYRDDEQTKLNLSIQRPTSKILGLTGELSFSIDWTNNTSSRVIYDYSGTTASVGFKLRL